MFTVPHASLAVGDENEGTAGHSIVEGPDTPIIVGGVRSLVHVTVLETVAVLPQPSLAINVLVRD